MEREAFLPMQCLILDHSMELGQGRPWSIKPPVDGDLRRKFLGLLQALESITTNKASGWNSSWAISNPER